MGEDRTKQSYHSQILDHPDLVAKIFEAFSIANVIDQATAQELKMRIVSVGHAVKATVLVGR